MKRIVILLAIAGMIGSVQAAISGANLWLASDGTGANTSLSTVTPANPWTTTDPGTSGTPLWWDRSGAGTFAHGVDPVLGAIDTSFNANASSGNYGDEIVTTITGLTPGTSYEVWVLFTDDTRYNDGIMAGLASGNLIAYTPANSTNTGLLSHTTSTWYLFEGSLGYVQADTNGEISVFCGTSSAFERTVYHGLAYQEVDPLLPPTPDPMTWQQPPLASGTSITMTAATASDPEGAVEYYFACTSGGGHDSGWQTEPTYTDINLAFDTEYAYTVKARDIYASETAPSNPASATTQSFIVIDDFDYELNAPTLISHWVDGSSNATGSSISPYLAFYMNLSFDNTQSPYYSEVAYTFTARDWNAADSDLSFWYLGDPTVDELYVRLRDGSAGSDTLRITDPAVTQSADWVEVRLRLDDFTGVDRTQVTGIALGIGPESPSGPGTAGGVGFDEIRVTAHECDPSRAHLDADGNCVIDMGDVLVLAENWLLQAQILTASAPDDAQLVLHYAFEETGSETTVSDSSSHNNDAVIQPTVSGFDPTDNWQSGGIDGSGCLDFDGRFLVSVPQTAFAGIDNAMTVSFWHYADMNDYPQILTPFTFTTNDSGTDDSVDWDRETPQPVSSGWNHYAFVKNATAGTMRIYENGILMAQSENTFGSMDSIDQSPCQIGLDSDGLSNKYLGKMDDFRVYSYALSQNEIIYLAQGPASEVQQPLVPLEISVDPNPDDRIDLSDFALIASEWLSEL